MYFIRSGGVRDLGTILTLSVDLECKINLSYPMCHSIPGTRVLQIDEFWKVTKGYGLSCFKFQERD